MISDLRAVFVLVGSNTDIHPGCYDTHANMD